MPTSLGWRQRGPAHDAPGWGNVSESFRQRFFRIIPPLAGASLLCVYDITIPYADVLLDGRTDLDVSAVQDVAHGVLLKLQRPETLKRVRATRSPGGYLATIIRNAANDVAWRSEAIGHFRRALAIRPDFREAQRNLDLMLAGRGPVK